jgi:hypothetical protein
LVGQAVKLFLLVTLLSLVAVAAVSVLLEAAVLVDTEQVQLL